MMAVFRPVDPAVVRRAAAEAERSAFKAALDAALRTLAAAALSAILSLALWQSWRWATASPLFAVREIQFTGLVHASEGEMTRKSGLAVGENLFRADLPRATRALESQPWVAAVHIERQLPGTLRIDVEEHRAAALVQAGALYVLDDEGRLFKRAAPDDGLDLPIITGATWDRAVGSKEQAAGATWDRAVGPKEQAAGATWDRAVGPKEQAAGATWDRAVGPKEQAAGRSREGWQRPDSQLRLLAALHLLDLWRAAGFAVSALSEVRLDDDGAFTLFAHDGRGDDAGVQEIRLGAADLSLKLRRLAQVRAALGRRGERATRIDLDNPARPDQAAATLADKR
jgi:cell division septal protein FtsQ